MKYWFHIEVFKMISSLFSEQRNEVEIVDETLGKTKKKMKSKLKEDKFDS